MVKFVFLFAFFLILQESYQNPLNSNKYNELEDVAKEYILAIEDANRIIEYVAGHLSSVSRDYEHKIDDTLDNENLADRVKNLQNSVHKIEADTNEDSKRCIDTAWRRVMVSTDELKRGVDSCISTARIIGAEINSKLETIDGKATKIAEEITNGFHTCLNVKNNDIVECLRNKIDPVKEELKELDQLVIQTHDFVYKKIEDGIRNLDICLQRTNEDFNLKSDIIITDLQTCVQEKKYFTVLMPRGIMDIIRQLKEKIENIIHILSHLPTSIEEIPEKINEIISHINIFVVISQLEDEIDTIITDGGSNAETCRPVANERLDALSDSAEKSVNKCISEAQNNVDKIKDSITALTDEAKLILSDISDHTSKCFSDNMLNPVEFAKCVGERVDEFQQRIVDLQTKVKETYEHAKDQADDIIKSLATCVNQAQIDTVEQGQILIKDINTCVLHS